MSCVAFMTVIERFDDGVVTIATSAARSTYAAQRRRGMKRRCMRGTSGGGRNQTPPG
jgi:hypothetical protein